MEFDENRPSRQGAPRSITPYVIQHFWIPENSPPNPGNVEHMSEVSGRWEIARSPDNRLAAASSRTSESALLLPGRTRKSLAPLKDAKSASPGPQSPPSAPPDLATTQRATNTRARNGVRDLFAMQVPSWSKSPSATKVDHNSKSVEYGQWPNTARTWSKVHQTLTDIGPNLVKTAELGRTQPSVAAINQTSREAQAVCLSKMAQCRSKLARR